MTQKHIPAPLQGVFSIEEKQKIGTGTTTRTTAQKTYWYCQELENDRFEVQLIGENNVPTGDKEIIAKEDFLDRFLPEPEMYFSVVKPAMLHLSRTLNRADRHREEKQLYSAELDYDCALEIDIENIRGNFGLALVFLERGEMDKAEVIFNRLIKLDAAFAPEHKHLFNEFGIKLRKSGLFTMATAYYLRALELSADDEHLLFNIARVFLEQRDIAKTVEFLFKAVDLNVSLEPAVRFLQWLDRKNIVPGESRDRVRDILLANSDLLAESQSGPASSSTSSQGRAAEGKIPYVPLASFRAPSRRKGKASVERFGRDVNVDAGTAPPETADRDMDAVETDMEGMASESVFSPQGESSFVSDEAFQSTEKEFESAENDEQPMSIASDSDSGAFDAPPFDMEDREEERSSPPAPPRKEDHEPQPEPDSLTPKRRQSMDNDFEGDAVRLVDLRSRPKPARIGLSGASGSQDVPSDAPHREDAGSEAAYEPQTAPASTAPYEAEEASHRADSALDTRGTQRKPSQESTEREAYLEARVAALEALLAEKELSSSLPEDIVRKAEEEELRVRHLSAHQDKRKGL